MVWLSGCGLIHILLNGKQKSLNIKKQIAAGIIPDLWECEIDISFWLALELYCIYTVRSTVYTVYVTECLNFYCNLLVNSTVNYIILVHWFARGTFSDGRVQNLYRGVQ